MLSLTEVKVLMKAQLWCAGLLLGLGIAPPPQDPAEPPRRRALLVGVSDYAAGIGWNPLPGAVNDVHALRELLIKRFRFTAEDIRLLLNEQASRKAILEAFREHLIEPAGEETVAVFFFAGHGTQIFDESGDESDQLDEALVPYYDPESEESKKYIGDDELSDLFEQLGSKTPLATGIFDCCHSGTNTRGAPRFAVRRLPPSAETYAALAEAPPRESEENREERSMVLDLSRMRSGPICLSACLDRQEALGIEFPMLPDFPECRGVFSTCLERILRVTPVQTTFLSLFARLRAEMRRLGEEYGFDQEPLIRCNADRPLFSGDYEPAQTTFAVNSSTYAIHLEVAAGWMHGIQVGTVLLVHGPPDEAGKVPEPVRCLVESVGGPQSCSARPLSMTRTSAPGDTPAPVLAEENAAIIQSLNLGSATFAENPAPNFAQRLLLPEDASERIRADLRQEPFFELTDGNDWQLRVVRSADGFQVFDRSGRRWLPHPLNPSLLSEQDLVQDLSAFALWRSIRSIENPQSPLYDAISLEAAFGTIDQTDPLEPVFEVDSKPTPIGPAGELVIRERLYPEPTLKRGLRIRIQNNWPKTVYMYAFNLLPDWRVAATIPSGGEELETGIAIEPGETYQRSLVITPELPKDYVPEVLRFFLSETPTNFSYIASRGVRRKDQQSAVKEVPTFRSAGTTQQDSGLSSFLRRARQGHRMRSAAPSQDPSPWTAKSLEWRLLPPD
jgi:hypothetical protein